ncbi:patatin [Pseudomonas knackmussii B13]|uniref:Patatin n=1 Tax=Pseudomonas knackmussii (strain DSM 6978 / CCUG 54928 / LMG 23759 / B13) TaxID=1301098 RepID=A0A024HH03_PSEKB|nr:patatin-like phospholipase family protein [Pseudomonas knackmussii]CDF83924.1 patatin [Pseudomonas knackmussii B13]
MSEYRILSLDGGGTWALLQAMALQHMFGIDARGHDVLRRYDLVAANSGGSIVLGGLFENLRLGELLEHYFRSESSRKRIFVRNSFLKAPLAGTLQALADVGPKYDASAKLDGLQSILRNAGNVLLTDLRDDVMGGDCPDIIVCAFDYQVQRARYFRSNPKSRAASFSTPTPVTLAEAIHASTNAPVNYFDAPAMVRREAFWDGGVAGLNNPVLAAVVDALSNEKPAADIRALSIGTATAGQLPRSKPESAPDHKLTQLPLETGLKADLRKLAMSIIGDPPDAATFIAHVSLGQKVPLEENDAPVVGNLVRLNPLIRPRNKDANGIWQAPHGFAQDEFLKLVKMDMDAVEEEDVNLIVRLGQGWIAGDFLNQPIRMSNEPYRCEIGHDQFAAAHQHARALGLVP